MSDIYPIISTVTLNENRPRHLLGSKRQRDGKLKDGKKGTMQTATPAVYKARCSHSCLSF